MCQYCEPMSPAPKQALQLSHRAASPGAVLLADQDLNGRQVIRELGGWYLCRIICVAVHLHRVAPWDVCC